eukprot:7737816-Pyramimonas_sp.AAC.1
MADTFGEDDFEEEDQRLLCDEIIAETPPAEVNGHGYRWQCFLDGSWISSDEASPTACDWSGLVSPNVDELMSYEVERIEGMLNERINSMIKRSEILRPRTHYIAKPGYTEPRVRKTELSAEVIRLSASERTALVLEILEVCERYELLPNTAALAVNYLDRFFSKGLTSPDIKVRCGPPAAVRTVKSQP